MYYKESKLILEEIRKAKKFILSCHREPDADSVGSNLSMYKLLKQMGKDVGIFSPNNLPEKLLFLPGTEQIKKLSIKKAKLSDYEVLISLDTEGIHMLTNDNSDINFPSNLKVLVIDHHKTNRKFGHINLVDTKVSSTCELLYSLFGDWNVELSSFFANYILAGIIGDTGAFMYSSATEKTFKLVPELIKKGADKDKIIFNLFFSKDVNDFKFWSVVFENMKLDKNLNFVWSCIPHSVVEKFGGSRFIPDDSGSKFFQMVKDTNFGMLLIEKRKNKLSVSLKARVDFVDVSKIARDLGGGGHAFAAGAIVELPYKKAVKKTLGLAKKYAKKHFKKGS